jgi:RNA polymerase sigma factor (sigma-70 family)
MTPRLAQRPRPDRGFERLYKRHVADVYRYALAVMRNPADAEDVTQTTFLNAYRAYVERDSRPEKPQNWLIAIAHNVCRQRFRQSARRPTEVRLDDDVADLVVDDLKPTGEDIRRALGHLAFNQRAALVMRELEGRSYVEIAEILDMSTSAVETLIFRARRALREQLEGALTCGEAEFATSRQLDGRLSRRERGQLRAHLRECAECASFARRQRAQRGALRSLAFVPVPGSLTSLFGGGGAAAGSGLALKLAASVTAGLVIGGAGYEGVHHRDVHAVQAAAAAPIVEPSAAPTRVRAEIGVVPVRYTKAHVTHATAARAHHPKPRKSSHGAKAHSQAPDPHHPPGHGKAKKGDHQNPAPQPAQPAKPSHTHKPRHSRKAIHRSQRHAPPTKPVVKSKPVPSQGDHGDHAEHPGNAEDHGNGHEEHGGKGK